MASIHVRTAEVLPRWTMELGKRHGLDEHGLIRSRRFMELIRKLVDFVLHLDRHLGELIHQMGPWIYVIMFLIIFCETGLVVTPFLPGDSLLFALGTFAALGSLHLGALLSSLAVAAILGDTVNYWVGAWIAPKLFRKENIRWLNPKHLERTHQFYERYGGKTIVIARFVPIVRTFAPLVAGIGAMNYTRFIAFNIAGGLLWTSSMILAGFFFGNLPVVKNNFTFVILAIIALSILPAVIEYWRERNRAT